MASVISKALKITGELESTEDIQIDGQIEGDVRGVGVKIGQNAKVKGTVYGDEVELAGTIEGDRIQEGDAGGHRAHDRRYLPPGHPHRIRRLYQRQLEAGYGKARRPVRQQAGGQARGDGVGGDAGQGHCDQPGASLGRSHIIQARVR